MTPPSRRRFTEVLAAAVLMAAAGCATAPPVVFDEERLADAVVELGRPTGSDLAALYRLRVGMRGGLRLAVLTSGDAGRMTVSKPFGDALSLTAWSDGRSIVHFDMDRGCREEVENLRAVIGVDALPIEQAVRLLAGRLPVGPEDEVRPGRDVHLEVRGPGWGAAIRLEDEPWRVVEVAGLARGSRWVVELGEHTGSIPGKIRVTNPDGRDVLLELLRMERPVGAVLPPLPDFPRCGPPR